MKNTNQEHQSLSDSETEESEENQWTPEQQQNMLQEYNEWRGFHHEVNHLFKYRSIDEMLDNTPED